MKYLVNSLDSDNGVTEDVYLSVKDLVGYVFDQSTVKWMDDRVQAVDGMFFSDGPLWCDMLLYAVGVERARLEKDFENLC